MVQVAVNIHAQPRAEDRRILLIEDNPDHAFLVRRAISESLKSQVDVVDTGEAGVAKVQVISYDLIISDFNLPQMNGLEFLKAVRELGIKVPVIMLTGQGDEKVAVAAMQAGAYNYLVKDDICYTILPRVISETLHKFESDKEKERLQKEIREKSAALEAANKELKKLDEMKSQFISSVSHEFRNPLNSVLESLGLILDGIVDPNSEKGKRILQIAKSSVDRLTVLVNDLLDFSKLEAGKMKMEKAPLGVSRVILDAMEAIRPLTNRKKQKLTSAHIDEELTVFADPVRIIQVLTNLIGNAIKFTPEEGQIEVGAEPFEDTAEPIHKVKIFVRDNGIGISQENILRIFERFEQIKQPHREAVPQLQGTGLGLSICQEIIKLHQGNIWAESELGKGSTFIFTLPRFG